MKKKTNQNIHLGTVLKDLSQKLDEKTDNRNPKQEICEEFEDMIADEFPDLEVPDEYESMSYDERAEWLVRTMLNLHSKQLEKLLDYYIKEEHKNRVKARKEGKYSINV